MNYTGRLIDGTVFDTTDGQDLPAYFRVREVSQNIVVYGMPSTSPANASWTLGKLVDQ